MTVYFSLCSSSGLLMSTLGGGVFWDKSSQDKFTHNSLSSLPEGEGGMSVRVSYV